MSAQPSHDDPSRPNAPGLYGLLAEFEDVDSLLDAARSVRQAGYTRWDAYSPFPVHRLDEAIGKPPTRLPWLVLATGFTGVIVGILLCWYANASALPVPTWLQGYRFVVSGKPIFSLPANVPVIFETAVLFGAFGAVFGMLALNRLPRLYHPLFGRPRFRRVTADRFFIAIEAADPRFDLRRTGDFLRLLSATAVEEVQE